MPATRDRTLAAFISDYLIGKQADFDLPSDFFAQLLGDGRAVLLLLDGLDEVANEAERERVRQAVEELVAGRNQLRVLVTCRTAAYRGRTALGSGFREVTVQPLDETHIRDMVRRFYGCIYPTEPAQAEVKTNELMSGLSILEAQRRKSREDVEPLVSSPLMVRLLLIVHYNDRQMPQQRVELFMKATETMLQLEYLPDVDVQQELRKLVGQDWTDHYEMAQHLAFHMHQQGEQLGHEIDESALRAIFRDTHYEPCVDQLLALTHNRGGLLEDRLGMYRFIHLGFQEYLAARYLIKVIGGEGGVEAMVRFFEDGPILESWWREPALFIPNYCVADSNSTLARNFLRRLARLTRKPGMATLSSDAQLAATEVAGRAALELRERDERLFGELAQRLQTLFVNREVMATAQPRLRAAAGVVLSKLGDPRSAVTQVDALQLCLVPAGPFCMGSAGDDREADKDERPHDPQFDLPYAYAIGQHLVTNAQFRAFVDDQGYAQHDWWDVAIADGLWADGRFRRRVLFYEDEQRQKIGERFEEATAPYDFGEPYNLRNHPVVGVSWYEALAFCKWLRARWREQGWLTAQQEVRLPNEPEWEKAARGGHQIPPSSMVTTLATLADTSQLEQLIHPKSQIANPKPARRYPWGDDADPRLANYHDTNIGATSAAGCFSAGASPYGCMDMAGNVWEWTRSAWGPWALKDGKYDVSLKFAYPYNPGDGREHPCAGNNIARVVRGGAFCGIQWGARCACRDGFIPDLHFYIGFRVVVSPFSSHPSVR